MGYIKNLMDGEECMININVMPRLLFFFTHMVVKLSYKMLKEIQLAFNKFVWGFKQLRIKNKVVQG